MSIARRSACLAMLLGNCGVALANPPTYNVTDITNWTAAQKATLPFFKHYAPLPAPNAPTDFHLVSRTSSGFYAGSTWNVFTGPDQRGVLLSATSVSIIDSWGDFHWWRTTPPTAASGASPVTSLLDRFSNLK